VHFNYVYSLLNSLRPTALYISTFLFLLLLSLSVYSVSILYFFLPLSLLSLNPFFLLHLVLYFLSSLFFFLYVSLSSPQKINFTMNTDLKYVSHT